MIEFLYFDMDGLIANFNKRCVDIMGHKFDEENAKECWRKINKVEDFWFTIEPYEGISYFFNTIIPILNANNIRYGILSGTCNSNTANCERDKILWINQHASEWFHPSQIHLCKSKNKKYYATPTSVLLDDRGQNIDDWKNHGGIAIWHDSDNESFDVLIQKILMVIENH